MTQVLVLDGGQRSALAATRSLGRRGITVHVADQARSPLAGASRYAASQRVCPSPLTRPREFTDWVVRTVTDLGLDAVLPLTDASTMLLNPRRDDLRPAHLLCAPQNAYELVSDKAKLVALAQQVGVRVPRTVCVQSVDELEQALAASTYPLVLKPARSRVLVGGNVVMTSVTVAHSAAEAREKLAAQPWFGSCPCLLQEFIDGSGAGVFAFYRDGKPLAWFAHRRIREKPPSGGVSVLSQSAAVDPIVRDASERILSAAEWSGAAMVEFRMDRSGVPYLMEVNGRLWGSLQLAIDSGVDFPWLLYASGMGLPIEPVPEYRVGQRLRWLLGDFDNLLIQIRDRRLSGKQKTRAAGAFVAASLDLSSHQEILRWSDPRPAFRELRDWLGALR